MRELEYTHASLAGHHGEGDLSAVRRRALEQPRRPAALPDTGREAIAGAIWGPGVSRSPSLTSTPSARHEPTRRRSPSGAAAHR